MIMALLIGLLLRGGKFLTLAARRTLWQMFENNICGPKLILDNDQLLKLVRCNEPNLFGEDKDIQTHAEVLPLQKEYEKIKKCASTGDNCEVKPEPKDFPELKELESEVDGALKNLEKALPQPQNDANLERILRELERKVQEVDASEPVFLPMMLPQQVARKKSDNFAKIDLEECISKYRFEEQQGSNEPILHGKPRDNYLKSSLSDDFHVKFGKSHKYFQRITEQFSSIASHAHSSLPNLAMAPEALNFYSCRTMHTKSEKSNSTGHSFMAAEAIENKISVVKKMLHDADACTKPPDKKMELGDDEIREMLDRKIKMLAEKKGKRKRKKINKSEIKEREKLLEINQKVFNKVEDDIKSVKIIKKDAIQRQLVNVDALLALLDDNPKVNFLKTMKAHKNLSHYENLSATDFIVHMRPNFLQEESDHKLNYGKLEEEIKENNFVINKQEDIQEESTVKVLVKFMAYEQIPRIYHMNKENLENEIRTKFICLMSSFKKTKRLQINKQWEMMNKMKLQEEVMKNSLLKRFIPINSENKKTELLSTMNLEANSAENVCVTKESVSKIPIENLEPQEPKTNFENTIGELKAEERKIVPEIKEIDGPTKLSEAPTQEILSAEAAVPKLERPTMICQDLLCKSTNETAITEDFKQNVEEVRKLENVVQIKLEVKEIVDESKPEVLAANKPLIKFLKMNETIDTAKPKSIMFEETNQDLIVRVDEQRSLSEKENFNSETKFEKCAAPIEKTRVEVIEIKPESEKSKKLLPSKIKPPKLMQTKIVSSKLEFNPEHTTASSCPMETKPTNPKEKETEHAPDFEKIKTDSMQNSLPETPIPAAKSRIPIRKPAAENSGAMDAANETIKKIALEYKNQKAGRNSLIPNLNVGIRRKMRALQRKSDDNSNKSSKTSIKEAEETSAVENVAPEKIVKVAASTEEKSVLIKEESTEDVKVAESESQVLKNILEKEPSELKTKTDLCIENEKPPNFDLLDEIDLVDIPTDEDRLEVPAEKKHTVVHSEKSMDTTKLCCESEEEKELATQLLANQPESAGEPKEENASAPKKPNLIVYPLSELHRSNRLKSDTADEEEKQKANPPKQEKQVANKKQEEWKLDTKKEYPLQLQHPHPKCSRSANDVEAKTSSSEQQKDVKEPLHKNVLKNVPPNIGKTQSFTTLPKYTFWNRQPKVEVNPNTAKKEKEEPPKQIKEEPAQKKYKFVTDEIDGITGEKIKVTKLVEDV